MRFDRRGAAARALVATLLFAGGCSGSDGETGPTLRITPSEASVPVGGSVQLSAINASGAVTWSSSDETVAAVVSTGFVTGKKPGQATITAADSRGSVTANVTVLRPPALALSTNSLAFTLVSGGAEATQTVQVTDAGDEKVGALSVASVTMPPGQPGGWITATLAAATAPTQLSVRVVPASLAPGVYSATISVAGAGAVNGPQTVVVTATIGAPPTLVLSRTALTFNGTRGGANPPSQTVDISNGGTGTITGLAATTVYGAGQPTGWLTASLNGTSAPAVLTLAASLGSLADGTYSATVSVAAAGVANSPRPVAVTFVVGPGPSIALSSTSVGFSADPGGPSPAAQTVTITNAGGGALTELAAAVSYAAGQPTGWLTTAALDETTAPAVLTLRPTVGTLAAGSYTATVAVSSPVASNSPRTITVTLTVGPPPSLVLGATTVSVSANRGATSSSVAVSVTRSGGGAIPDLTSSISYQSGSGWLTATLEATTTPTTLTLQASAGTLAPGQYTATVSVATPNATNSPRTLTVTFTVLWSLASDVYPAIAPYCTGCHFAGGSAPNLSSAGNFHANLVGQATTVRTGFPLATTHPVRIVPGNANISYVMDQIVRVPGAFPMPTSGPGVPTNIINLLAAWINQGAPQN